MDTLHELLSLLIQFSITFLEFVGVVIILVAGIQAVYNYVRHDPHARLNLCKAMAMALEFKLGGEILRTVIVRDFSELALVGCIILLRAALSFLIHLGIRREEAEAAEETAPQKKSPVLLEEAEDSNCLAAS